MLCVIISKISKIADADYKISKMSRWTLNNIIKVGDFYIH